MRYFWRIYESIENLIVWFPLIWKDRDFDDGYLLKIMIFKMKRMEKFFDSDNTWTLDAWKHADEIKEVRKLLERVYDDEENRDKAFQCYNENYGDLFEEFLQDGFPLGQRYKRWWVLEEVEDDLGRKDLLMVRKTDQEDRNTMFREAMWRENFLNEKDLCNAFDLMAMKMRTWWD